MTEPRLNLRAALEALRKSYFERLLTESVELRGLVERLHGTEAAEDRAVLERICLLAHGLAGSGATFGYGVVTDHAQPLEGLTRRLLEGGFAPAPKDLRQIDALVASLESVAAEAAAPSPIALSSGEKGATAITSDDRQLVLLVEEDAELARDLAWQVSYFGYQVKVLTHPGALPEELMKERPAALVLDMSFPAAGWAGTKQDSTLDIPKLFISERADLSARLEAVRAGGVAFFPKPVEVNLLVDTLAFQTARRPPLSHRVLIIDDDEQLAQGYALTLRDAGMIVTVVTDPLKALEPLLELMPDVILLDMYMPGCGGPELAAVLRQDPTLVSVPIIFLSTESDPSRQLAVLRHGGDEFLVKPVPLDRLVDEVAVRAQRARALRAHMVRDSLTGLFNHATVKQLLSVEVARAQRDDRPLAAALIDVDDLRGVNSTHGHAGGDRVLKNLAWLLQKRLRRTDLVGRYGGEEFLIVLPSTSAEAAGQVLDGLRETFGQIRQQLGSTGFFATFSGGVAGVSGAVQGDQLIEVADQALSEAKRAGRNRVFVRG